MSVADKVDKMEKQGIAVATSPAPTPTTVNHVKEPEPEIEVTNVKVNYDEPTDESDDDAFDFFASISK